MSDDQVQQMFRFMEDFRKEVNARLDVVDSSLDNLETRIGSVETGLDTTNLKLGSFHKEFNSRLDVTDAKIDGVMEVVDGLAGRIDDQDTEDTMRDAQFGRLVEWAHKTSAVTKVPLTDL